MPNKGVGATACDEKAELASEEKCRVCTISSDCFSYMNIFEKIIFKNVLVLDALTLITSLEIHPDDGLPKEICCRCEQRLLDAYHFRRLAESSAKQFERLNQSGEFPQTPKCEKEIIVESTSSTSMIETHVDENYDIIVLDMELQEEHLLSSPTQNGNEETASCEERLIAAAELNQVDSIEIDTQKQILHDKSNDPLPAMTIEENLSPKSTSSSKKRISYAKRDPPAKRESMILQRLPLKRSKPNPAPAVDIPKSYKSSVRKQSTSPASARKKPKTEDVVSFLIEKIDTAAVVEHHKTANSTKPAIPSDDPEYAKRKHECQVCQKRFVGKSNLVDHLRFHANVKPFKCDQCDKAFVQSGSLRCHMRSHTKEKPFVCSYCAKAFGQSSSLKIHIRSHTQERQYACDLCAKRFKSNSDLGKHRGIHDAVKRYKCDACDQSFAQNGNLRKHIRKNHAEVV